MKSNLIKHGIIFFCLFFSSKFLSAQQHHQIAYGYDLSGNRIVRMAVVLGTENPTLTTWLMGQSTSGNNNNNNREKKNFITNPVDSSTLSLKITAYPNPTFNSVTISISNLPVNATGYLKVMDLSGKIIIEKSSILSSNILDFSNQAAGMYYVTIVANDYKSDIAIIKVQ